MVPFKTGDVPVSDRCRLRRFAGTGRLSSWIPSGPSCRPVLRSWQQIRQLIAGRRQLCLPCRSPRFDLKSFDQPVLVPGAQGVRQRELLARRVLRDVLRRPLPEDVVVMKRWTAIHVQQLGKG